MNESELYSAFDRTEFYYGNLMSDVAQGQGFANFQINPFKSNDMFVTLTHVTSTGLGGMSFAAGEASFVRDDGWVKITARLRHGDYHLGGAQETSKCGVDEFSKTFAYNHTEDKTIDSTQFEYFSPLAPVLVRQNSHSGKIEINGVRIILKEESFLHEINNDTVGIPVRIEYRQGKTEFSLPQSVSNTTTEARAMMDSIDKALSILTKDCISWSREVSKTFNKAPIQLAEQELIRWAVKPKGRYAHYSGYGGNLSESVGVLANAIHSLPDNLKEVFDKIYTCLTNAWLAPYYELYLVIWHSCLDVFRDFYGHGGARFSANLVRACGTANVTFLDLFQNNRDNLIAGTEKFKFNELRDEYLHKGLVISDFQTTMDQIRRMRALAERFLLRFLGLEEQFHGLGSFRMP